MEEKETDDPIIFFSKIWILDKKIKINKNIE